MVSRSEYESMKAELVELNQQNKWLMEQLRLNRHRQFGASSEKSEYDQLNLFNEAEVTADERATEPELTEVAKHYRKKASESKDRLPPDLPVEVVEHTLPEDEQDCPQCGEKLHIIGRDIQEAMNSCEGSHSKGNIICIRLPELRKERYQRSDNKGTDAESGDKWQFCFAGGSGTYHNSKVRVGSSAV